MKTIKHILSVINIAVNNGLEIDITDSIEDIFQQAEEELLENEPEGSEMIHCILNEHGMNQYYNFVEADGTEHDCNGEIFDFPKAKAEDDVYYKKEGDAYTPCNWFDIPDGEERKNYIFVYDKVVCSNGVVAHLYDYMA